MAKLNLSAPWVIYYKEVNVFFEKDPDVKVLYDDDRNEIELYVSDSDKASALRGLLPVEKTFGEVKLKVTVIPANGANFGFRASNFSTIQAALKNNPIVDRIETVSGLFDYDLHYVLFRKEVVQYFTDDLGDYNGYCSTLYENIAIDIFEDTTGVFFCTNNKIHMVIDTGVCGTYKGNLITSC